MRRLSKATVQKCKEPDIRRLCKFLEIDGYADKSVEDLIVNLQEDCVVSVPEEIGWGSNEWLLRKLLKNVEETDSASPVIKKE